MIILPNETLNKSILDFSALGNAKCDLELPYKIRHLQRPILEVHPCTAGSSDLSELP